MDRVNDPKIRAALMEGERRSREICNPDDVNTRAFADQRRKIKELAGEEACLNAYVLNHTPTSNEKMKAREGYAL